MKQIFLAIVLALPLLSSMLDETKWITQINQTDQEIVIHLINNKLNKYASKELLSKAKSFKEKNEIIEVNSLYKLILSKLATKNPVLQEKLKKEHDQLSLMYISGGRNPDDASKYNMLFNDTSLGFKKYSMSELKLAFNKYKEKILSTTNAIIRYVEQVLSDAKNDKNNERLAKEFSSEIQKIIGQNNGKIRVISSLYLISSFAYNETLVMNYQIVKKEFIRDAMAKRELTYRQALESLMSSDFKDKITRTYTENFHNYYCKYKPTAEALKKGLEIAINISLDDGTYLSGPIEINKFSCLSYGHKL